MDRAELTQLLTRLKDGDRAAFDPAFALLWPLLRAFAERYVGAADADDAAQAALLAIYARASDFDPTRDGAAWALGIAAWECRTLRKRRQRRKEEQGVFVDGADSGESPEDVATARELREAVQEVLGDLRPLDAETLMAVGTRTGATFRKRVSRALSRFRVAWRARHGNE